MTQLSLGEALKQNGMAQAAANSHRFVDVMRGHAITISQACGVVSTDDLRTLAQRLALEPSSPNAWGSVLGGKDWEHVGWKKSEWPGNHRRHIQIWRYRG